MFSAVILAVAIMRNRAQWRRKENSTMKKSIAVALAAVAGFACASRAAENMIGRQTQNEGIFATPAKGAIAIDGVISPDEWDLSGQIQSYADSGTKDFYSVKSAAMWDADNLYLSFDWRDPMPLNSRVDPAQDPSRGWVADAIQLRVTADGQSSWITIWGFDYANGIKPACDIVYATEPRAFKGKHPSSKLYYTGKPNEFELGDGIAVAYRMADDSKGFTQEVRIPWKHIYLNDAAKGAADMKFRMGIEFLYGAASGTGFPVHRYIDNMQPGKTSREFYWTAFDSWGDVTLASGSVEPRKYVEGSLKPQGTIPLRMKVPADAKFFTIAINSPDGKRLRNVAGGYRVEDFTVETADGMNTVEVMWDGLTEDGNLVKAGEYQLVGLSSGALDGYYEMSFYNPGTPAWQTRDKTGAWGADHTIPHLVTRSGDNVVICCSFAEGGYGTFVVKPDGTKAWSEIRGSDVLAATADYVFTIPNDWGTSGAQILRMDAKTGAFAPSSEELPMPLPLATLFGVEAGKAPRVLALATSGDSLVMVTSDARLRIFDAATAAPRGDFPFALKTIAKAAEEAADNPPPEDAEAVKPSPIPFAANDSAAFCVLDGAIMRVDLATGAVTPLALSAKPEKPTALAIDADGNLYVADDGARHQVLKFNPADGKLLLAYGREGGRALEGKFEPDGMRYITSITVDAANRLWVTETSRHPRRVSVWAPDGAFERDFIGNTGYAGQGSLIHDGDATVAVAEMNELWLNPETHEWGVKSIMFNPDPEKGDFFSPGSTAFHSGNVFASSASGESHEYFSCLGDRRNTPFFLMMKVGDDWSVVAAIASVGRLQNLLGGQYGAQVVKDSFGAWADLDPSTILVWNDFNNDGYVTREECEIVPPTKPSRPQNGKSAGHSVALDPCSNTTLDPDDLGFFATRAEGKATRTVRIAPVSFRDGGKPVYKLEGVKDYPCDFTINGAATSVPGKDTVVGFINLKNRVYVAGWRKSTGEILWKYLSPYHQVHGSHNATMPRPGLLIGCLKVCGVALGCGDSDVFMVRGNLGEDYYLTTDGLFVNILTKDGRIPGVTLPEDEETLRATSFASLQGRGEHFSGIFAKHNDGVCRCSGAVPASQAGNIIRIEGLDSIRHLAPSTVAVTDEQLVAADADNTRRVLESKAPTAPLTAAQAPLDGQGRIQWGRVKAFPIERQGQPVSANFRLAYDAGQLALRWEIRGDSSPWKNGGNDWHILFKTGDCVDFQLSPTGNKKEPVDGDFRLIIAPFQDQNAVVLMRPRLKGATDGFKYTSPVQTLPFDSVSCLALEPDVQIRDNNVTVTLSVPWTMLGMVTPAVGTELSGDVGFILSNNAGTENAARIYRSNKSTNLVNDQPGEAALKPQGFSGVIFE